MQNSRSSLIDIFKRGTVLMQLIYINVAVFVFFKLLTLILILFNVNIGSVITYLELPSNLHTLLRQPWSVVSYMFMHVGFGHLFFNMIALYWFGRIALEYYSQKQLLAMYLTGGIAGAALYVAAYNIFPYFNPLVDNSYLLGASGSVLAICVAAAVANPHYVVRIMFLGEIKLIWIALTMVIVSLLGITGGNAGGEFAHIGGAILGYFYGKAWQRGSDWSRPVTKVMNFFTDLFKPKEKKYKGTYHRNVETRAKTDAEYNRERRANEIAIDAILDKIKQHGYESLTAEEKRELFDRSKH